MPAPLFLIWGSADSRIPSGARVGVEALGLAARVAVSHIYAPCVLLARPIPIPVLSQGHWRVGYPPKRSHSSGQRPVAVVSSGQWKPFLTEGHWAHWGLESSASGVGRAGAAGAGGALWRQAAQKELKQTGLECRVGGAISAARSCGPPGQGPTHD